MGRVWWFIVLLVSVCSSAGSAALHDVAITSVAFSEAVQDGTQRDVTVSYDASHVVSSVSLSVFVLIDNFVGGPSSCGTPCKGASIQMVPASLSHGAHTLRVSITGEDDAVVAQSTIQFNWPDGTIVESQNADDKTAAIASAHQAEQLVKAAAARMHERDTSESKGTEGTTDPSLLSAAERGEPSVEEGTITDEDPLPRRGPLNLCHSCNRPTDKYLSIIIGAHNHPTYGGSSLNIDRLQRCIDLISGFAEKAELTGPNDIEWVIIDWNPPPNTKPLRHALRWPSTTNARVITVPPEVHARWPNPFSVTTMEYLARNVGLRRARGEFVMFTTGDSVPNQQFWNWLALRLVNRDCYYRMERLDTNETAPARLASSEWEEFAKVRHPEREVPHENGTNLDGAVIWDGEILHRYTYNEAAGDFLMASRDACEEVNGFLENSAYRVHIDTMLIMALAFSGRLREVLMHAPYALYHQFHVRRVPNESTQSRDYLRGGHAPYDDFRFDVRQVTKFPLRYNKWDWGHPYEDFMETTFVMGMLIQETAARYSRDWGDCQWEMPDDFSEQPYDVGQFLLDGDVMVCPGEEED